MHLYNRVGREELKRRLMEESFERKTLSLYRYYRLNDPKLFRDQLYKEWSMLGCFGRIYVAREGINAQLSIPEQNHDAFLNVLKNHAIFNDIPIKYAIEDDGKSFYKLTIKVRPKLVADGLDDDAYDVTNVGNHLNALEFHRMIGEEDAVVVDMRNHYESEIGYFQGAIRPEADTFREEITLVNDMLQDQKDKKILLYCTGGIRCEKASAYLKHHGFKDVNQLHGGILEYVRRIRSEGLQSKFVGKNFVFDERLGESVDGQIISNCHQCGKPCDVHVNCGNELCHILFIQCPECAEKMDGCCTPECRAVKNGSIEEKYIFREKFSRKFGNKKVYRKSFLLVNKG